MTRSLLDAAADALALEELLEEAEGELSPALESWLNEVESNIAVKVDHYQEVMSRMEATVKRLNDKASQILKAADSIERTVDGMKSRIQAAMLSLGKTELRGETFRFKMSPTAGQLIVSDDAFVPEQFIIEKTVQSVDGVGLKDYIKNGGDVMGCIIKPGYSIRAYVNKEGKK